VNSRAADANGVGRLLDSAVEALELGDGERKTGPGAVQDATSASAT